MEPFAPPEHEHEAKFAYALLAPGRELALRVLHELLKGPKRYRA